MAFAGRRRGLLRCRRSRGGKSERRRQRRAGVQQAEISQGFEFQEIVREVEAHLNGIGAAAVFVEAIHIGLELSTIADYLMPTLLESDLHVITRRSTNIIPEDGLLNTDGMPGPG